MSNERGELSSLRRQKRNNTDNRKPSQAGMDTLLIVVVAQGLISGPEQQRNGLSHTVHACWIFSQSRPEQNKCMRQCTMPASGAPTRQIDSDEACARQHSRTSDSWRAPIQRSMVGALEAVASAAAPEALDARHQIPDSSLSGVFPLE